MAVDEAIGELEHQRRRALEASALALAAAALAPPAALLVSPALALALAIGAVFEATLALAAVLARRELIGRLAVEPEAYAIPEVAAYGRRLATLRQRARLAGWIEEVLAEANSRWSLYLADRVAAYARDLEGLARVLATPAAVVPPASVALCLRLLTHAYESPLYNPRLPAEELGRRLRRIREAVGGEAASGAQAP